MLSAMSYRKASPSRLTRRSTTNPTALVSRRLDWRRERDRSSESALSRSDWVCFNVRLKILSKTGYIYFLTNPSYEGLLKIGVTSRTIQERLSELRTTGVPAPFHCVALFQVGDPKGTELHVHRALKDYRESSDREFFRISLKAALEKSLGHILSAVTELEIEDLKKEVIPLNKVQKELLEYTFGEQTLTWS